MIILVLNCGSSSVKYALYNWSEQKMLTTGNIERIGQEGGHRNHKEAISHILSSLTEGEVQVISDIHDIKAVGHRVVHGGDKFNKSTIVTPEVLNVIKEVASLAPLHNPPNIVGIESAMEVLPEVKQIAVFDTAFHQTIPEQAFLYALPFDWYTDFGVRRYGFHGSSHLYVSKRAAKLLGKAKDDVNLITLHIGNGVSFTAIRQGVSVDTSMGMTPLEGAVMGTRSGDIDPAIIEYIMARTGKSCAEITSILNKKSGHLGITQQYTDRRDIEKEAKAGNERAKLSLEIEIYRIKKYIGAYMAVLGKVDAIIFTAGVGENNAYIRRGALQNMENFGINLDLEKNEQTRSSGGEACISTAASSVKVFMIPTNEEAVLVEDVVALLEDRYDQHLNYHYRFED